MGGEAPGVDKKISNNSIINDKKVDEHNNLAILDFCGNK